MFQFVGQICPLLHLFPLATPSFIFGYKCFRQIWELGGYFPAEQYYVVHLPAFCSFFCQPLCLCHHKMCLEIKSTFQSEKILGSLFLPAAMLKKKLCSYILLLNNFLGGSILENFFHPFVDKLTPTNPIMLSSVCKLLFQM